MGRGLDSGSGINWNRFFYEGTPVVALPSWKVPRIYVVAYPWRWRWSASSLMPAYRLSARIGRWLLRVGAQVFGRVRTSQGPSALNDSFGWMPNAVKPVAVLVGAQGPTQKLVVLLVDPTGRKAAYVKYGESPVAKKRLVREFLVLSSLPGGVGPKPLGLRTIGTGLALFLSPVEGRPMPGRVFPSAETIALLRRLWAGSVEVFVDKHPWVQRLLGASPCAEAWVNVLSFRRWPVVPMHGDLAPWNVLSGPAGICLIDWEFGSLEGFPGVDLAYHVLQVGALLKRWAPTRAREKAIDFLSREMDLIRREAEAIVRLAALDAYLQAMEDGHAPDDPLQVWRWQVWEEPRG